MALFMQPGGRALPGNGNHGCQIHIGIGDAGNQVGCSGPQGGQADPCPAGETAVNIRHKGSALFMAGQYKLNIAIE